MSRLVVVASLLLATLASRSSAQAPDRLDHYRVLPRLSTVLETGGIAGVSNRYRVLGEYDFVRFSQGLRGAAFQDAELWGSIISDDPHIAIVLDVDEAFNLEGLQGEMLPLGAPFDAFAFRGQTGDGSSVKLFTALMGRWMFVYGGTQAPPGSADFFEYKIRALARSGPSGDFNEDGVVDAADYTTWRDAQGSGDVSAAMDANADGRLDNADLSVWREQYGDQAPDTSLMESWFDSALTSAASSAAPEPAALGFILLGAACLAGRRAKP